MHLIKHITGLISVCWLLIILPGCGGKEYITAPDGSAGPLVIYPDYKDVTIPANIAPLNFRYAMADVRKAYEGEEPEGLSCFDKLIWLDYEVHSFMEKNIDYRLLAYLYSAQIVKESFSALLNRNRYYYRYVERLMEQGQKNGELTDEMPVSEMVRYFSMGERALVTEWCMNNGTFSLGEFSKRIFPVMMQGLKKA